MVSLKDEILRLLEEDKEFRYAIAGYLGLLEIMRRLDVIAEEQVKLREEQTKIWSEIKALHEEQVKLREEQVRLREEQTKIWSEIKALRMEQIRFREELNKIWSEIRSLREEQVKLGEEQIRLREDFNEMLKEIRSINLRLGRVERTLEKLTLDIEEEARSILKYRIKKDFGLEMEIGRLVLPELELNLYGVSGDICVVGEASVRAGVRVLEGLLEKIEKLKARYPEKLRKRVIPVIYTSLPMPDLVERARLKKIWVLKATEDIVKPDFTISGRKSSQS